jgi:hypothetical protein
MAFELSRYGRLRSPIWPCAFGGNNLLVKNIDKANREVLTTTRFPFEIAEAYMMVLLGMVLLSAAVRFQLQVLQRFVSQRADTRPVNFWPTKGVL